MSVSNRVAIEDWRRFPGRGVIDEDWLGRGGRPMQAAGVNARFQNTTNARSSRPWGSLLSPRRQAEHRLGTGRCRAAASREEFQPPPAARIASGRWRRPTGHAEPSFLERRRRGRQMNADNGPHFGDCRQAASEAVSHERTAWGQGGLGSRWGCQHLLAADTSRSRDLVAVEVRNHVSQKWNSGHIRCQSRATFRVGATSPRPHVLLG